MLFYHLDISPAFCMKFFLMGQEMEMQNVSFGAVRYLLSLDIQGPKADLQLRRKIPFKREDAVAERKIFRTI